MAAQDLSPVIEAVAARHDLPIAALREVAATTERELGDFRQDLASTLALAEGMDVILTGSFARRETTRESDCDFLILVAGVPDHRLITELLSETRVLVRERQLNEPGAQGVFGDFAITTELLARIGLDGDTNTNTTRRLLLLFESVSVGNEAVRKDAIDQLLRRYCFGYHPDVRASDAPFTVPRFLLNDLARYWRMVCVDFGAKQWRSARQDWYLRYAKLITTRKVLFAGSLVSVLLTETLPHRAGQAGYDALIEHLGQHANLTPLARLLSGYESPTTTPAVPWHRSSARTTSSSSCSSTATAGRC